MVLKSQGKFAEASANLQEIFDNEKLFENDKLFLAGACVLYGKLAAKFPQVSREDAREKLKKCLKISEFSWDSVLKVKKKNSVL
jgi:hypothetical protein